MTEAKIEYLPLNKKMEVVQKLLALLDAEIPGAKYLYREQIETLALAYIASTGATNLLERR